MGVSGILRAHGNVPVTSDMHVRELIDILINSNKKVMR